MANRVIKDSIWSSPTLAKLPPYFQDQWTRWLLMADDWGCFNADPEIIKGIAYPKRKETIKKILQIREVFNKINLLFIWKDRDREWAFFTKWDSHQFIGATEYNNKGERVKHRRKTPQPPKELLDIYLKQTGTIRDGLEQSASNPIPNPIPNPKPKKDKPSCSRNSKPEFLERVEKLKSLILQNNPKAKPKTTDWANSVRLMVERDNRTLVEIDEVMEFSQNDDFWKTNVLSMGKLREQFDQLTMKMRVGKEPKLREASWCPNCKKTMADCGDYWHCTDCNKKFPKEITKEV